MILDLNLVSDNKLEQYRIKQIVISMYKLNMIDSSDFRNTMKMINNNELYMRGY